MQAGQEDLGDEFPLPFAGAGLSFMRAGAGRKAGLRRVSLGGALPLPGPSSGLVLVGLRGLLGKGATTLAEE